MPAPAELYADATATEDSQAESQAIIGQSPAPKGGLRWALAAGVSIVLAGAATVAVLARSGGQTTNREFNMVSAGSTGGGSGASVEATVVWRTGCKNWEKILIKAVPDVANKEACTAQCSNTTGCVQGNYQTNDCQENDAVLGVKAKMCNLYGGACEEVENACWDLMKLSVEGVTPTAHRTGCTNFDAIKMGGPTFEDNQYQCVNKCAGTSGCVSVNYQPGKCSGSQMAGKGACYMFNGQCDKTENPCWDLYEGIGTPTTTAGSGSTTTAGSR